MAVKPDRRPVLALVDADVLAYQAAAGTEKIISLDGEVLVPVCRLSDAFEVFENKLDSLLRKTHAKDFLLCFSDDTENNFRRAVWPGYKANREGKPKPVILSHLKRFCMEEYPDRHILRPRLEADDCLGILATRASFRPDRRKVICSIDKDLRGVPGNFFDLGHPEGGVLRIAPEAADLWFITQTLTGDPTDNYPGCPGIGPATAHKLLKDAGPDMAALWAVVLAAYEKAGLTEADALAQARVVRILRASDYDFKQKKVKLWNPPKP